MQSLNYSRFNEPKIVLVYNSSLMMSYRPMPLAHTQEDLKGHNVRYVVKQFPIIPREITTRIKFDTPYEKVQP